MLTLLQHAWIEAAASPARRKWRATIFTKVWLVLRF